MIQESFGLLARVFYHVVRWFEMILVKDNFDRYLLYGLFIVLTYNFLLDPLLRRSFSGGSDHASKKGGNQTKSKPSDKMSDKN